MNNTEHKGNQYTVRISPVMELFNKIATLEHRGIDVLNLCKGEPDIDTPEHIKSAAIEAINNNQTKYTVVDGILSLREAIANKLQRENGLFYHPDQIIVSCGAKHSLYNIARSLINKEDEVAIISPYWASYPDIVLLSQGNPKIINTNSRNGFKVTVEQLNSVLSDKTRLLIFNNPVNPTGTVYSKQELLEIGAVLAKYPNLYIISDEVYEHISWLKGRDTRDNLISTCPELYNKTILVNSVSKTYGMTGWRIGYAATPNKEIIKKMRIIQSQSTSNPCSISQIAAQVALSSDQSNVVAMCKSLKSRHDSLFNELSLINGLHCKASDGTFYLFVGVKDLYPYVGKINSDIDFADFLLNKLSIAVVPGTVFGREGYMRLSFAVSNSTLDHTVDKLKNAFGMRA